VCLSRFSLHHKFSFVQKVWKKSSAYIGTYIREQRRFLLIASKAAKPTETELATLLKPTADVIGEIQNFRQVQSAISLSL
jgi:preprotein translocase subunit Sss1